MARKKRMISDDKLAELKAELKAKKLEPDKIIEAIDETIDEQKAPVHVAEPATATEIKKSLGITKEDEKVARDVLETIKKKKTGGFVPAKDENEKALEAKKQRELKQSEERIKKLNAAATYILNCLEPGFCQDWMQAAQENRVKDIGVYVLGVFNRLSKMVDYMETDIEPEWDRGFVGYDQHLFCEYCKEEIEKPTNIKQRFCSNLCAKRYKDSNTTGVIYPGTNRGPTEEEAEEKQWEREQRREGARL